MADNKNPYDQFDTPANPYDQFDSPAMQGKGVPAQAPVEEPIDEPLVQKIMDKAASVNAPITREEAVGRAKNLARMMKEGVPTIATAEGRPDTFGSGVGAAAEGILSGLTLGIGTDMFGTLMDTIGVESLGTAAQARRREYFPTISEVADIGAGIAQGGAGLLKSVAPKLVARGMQTTLAGKGGAALVRGLAETDLLAKALRGNQVRASSRILFGDAGQMAREAETGARSGKAFIDAKKAAGVALTEAEAEIDDVLTKGMQTTLGDKAEELARRVGATATGGRITRKAAARIAEEATMKEREQFIIDKATMQGMQLLGVREPTRAAVGKALMIGEGAAAGTIAGTIAGGLRGASSGFREAQMTPNDGDILAEDLASKMWIGAKEKAVEGAFVGAGVGLAIPLTAAGVGKVVDISTSVFSKLGKAIIPRAGSLFTGIRPQRLEALISAKDAIASTGLQYGKIRGDIERSIQFQHDNAERLVNHIDSSMSGMVLEPAERAVLTTLRSELNTALGNLRSNLMKADRHGNYKVAVGEIDNFYNRTDISNLTPPEVVRMNDVLTEYQILGDLYAAAAESRAIAAGMPVGSFPPATPSPSTIAGRRTLQDFAGMRSVPLPVEGYSQMVPRAGLTPYDVRADIAMTRGMTPSQNAIDLIFTPKVITRELEPLVKPQLPPIVGGVSAIAAAVKGGGYGEIIGTGVAAKTAADLFLDPATLIENYGRLQQSLIFTKDLTRNFAEAIGRKGTAQATAIKTLTEKRAGTSLASSVGLSVKEGVDPAKYSYAMGNQLYEEDKALFKEMGNIVDMVDTFGSDYNIADASFPELAKGVAKTSPKQAIYLKKKMDAMGDKPTEQQKYAYGIASLYTRNPLIIYDDIVRKRYVSDEALQALREVHSGLLFQIQKDLYGAVIEAKKNNEKIDARQQLIVKKLLGTPAFDMSPADLKRNQDAIQLPTGGGGGFNSKLPQLEREGLPR